MNLLLDDHDVVDQSESVKTADISTKNSEKNGDFMKQWAEMLRMYP